MCSQHRPENGADSAPIDSLDRGCQEPGCFATWVAGVEEHVHEKPYRAFCEDFDGDRYWVTVQAIGPQGAKHTARQTAIDRGHDIVSILKVEEAA